MDGLTRFIVAEYCAGPFYAGWWLYERENNAGSPGSDRFRPWGTWLQSEFQRRHLVALLAEMGEHPPEDRRYSQGLAEWFAGRFPNGLSVEIDPYFRYRLLKVCSSRPRQRRGVIRTLRGAAMADRARAQA